MSVPVLSKTIVLTSLAFSKLLASLKNKPKELAFWFATKILIGVASPKAQGQEITKTDTNTSKAIPKFHQKSGLGAMMSHTTNAKIAIEITLGTNTLETLSAKREISAFEL